ncbi:MAG: DUF3520 domain-containing protein [Chloroflexi bacterium]|nr:DUF3520 domain-containing protein [Chloroflexota bacterium]MYF79076.1 DUF3520 domain-containing protein [Chloroflexota bacterium]MYK61294.1 DUF3520 domain-containing protein [Chloroflexota bacterium]
MTNNKTEQLKSLITKPMTAFALVIATAVVVATIACSESETVVQTVVVEKSVPGEQVLQTVIVEREVAVPGETVVRTVVIEKEMEVQSEPVIQTVVVDREVEVMGETVVQTVIVEKEVVVEVEREVIREVEVEKVVEAEVAVAATSRPVAEAASVGHPTPVVKTSPPVQPSQPGATTFQNTTRSNFALTSQDDTSTFSLDTDRTSFQLALNWTRAGYEVDPASVRAEEWINAFNYGYEFPRHDDSFNIQTDIIPHPLDSGLHLARVAFQAPDVVVDLPLNVTLVLDGSGSMADGNRVAIARDAAETIRTSLGRDDRMSIVHFDNNVKHHLTVRDDNPGSRALRDSIRDLRPDGGTNVQAGLDLGVQLADEMRRNRPHAYNYVILMSDGVANVDATNPFAILESASDNNPDNPLRLITIGVGINNYNDVLLEQLAQYGNGWYRYLSEPEEGRRLFNRDNWLALSVPFADQTRAQVVWDENLVRSWRMIGYENRVTSDESFTRAEKKFAELPAGSATTVFFELELVDQYVLGNSNQPLGEVEVRWVTPSTGEGNRQHQEIDSVLAVPEATTDFGAIVALAADRYSGLHEYSGGHPGSIHRDLSDLANMLRGVGSPMAGTTAYHDFEFVLNSLVDNVQPAPSTGYSR